MSKKFQIVTLTILVFAIIGFILYVCYKRYYEKQINKVLEDMGKKIHVISIAKVITCYALLSAILLFLIAYKVPTTGDLSCTLISQLSFSMDKETIKQTLVDDLQQEGETYSYQQVQLDDHMNALYACNDTRYGYVLQYRMNREPQNNEVFCIENEGAISYISVDEVEDGVISFGLTGNRTGTCDQVQMSIHIYNFCEGENKYPVDITRTITIHKGGEVS